MFSASIRRNRAKDATPSHKVGGYRWIQGTRVWVTAAAIAIASAGCAAEVPESSVETGVVTGTTQQRIFGGAKDDDGDAIAGVVALRVGSGSTFELCTGALIAPNVVLTARHCVTKNITSSVAC